MSKYAKTLLIIVISLLVAGLIVFALLWNGEKFEKNNYTIGKAFSSLSLDTEADIVFALSDDGRCKVECYEGEKAKHSFSHSEDTLVIKMVNRKTWYDYIGIHFSTPKVTVYLPETQYAALSIADNTGDIKIPDDFQFAKVDILLNTGNIHFGASTLESLKIKTTTGDIRIENTSAGTLDLGATTGNITVDNIICLDDATLAVSTGKISLQKLVCKNLTASGNTGDMALTNVVASECLSIETNTGDVKFDSSDAAEIIVETDTGDVTGSILTEKIFLVETDTGSIQVPKTTTGGKCEITTTTGDIKILVINVTQ